jgi:hypothetical protein
LQRRSPPNNAFAPPMRLLLKIWMNCYHINWAWALLVKSYPMRCIKKLTYNRSKKYWEIQLNKKVIDTKVLLKSQK